MSSLEKCLFSSLAHFLIGSFQSVFNTVSLRFMKREVTFHGLNEKEMGAGLLAVISAVGWRKAVQEMYPALTTKCEPFLNPGRSPFGL